MVHQRNPFPLEEAGLILNPLGGKNLREAPFLLALANHVGLEVKVARNFKEITRATREFLPAKKLLLVSGGDGTVSAVLTASLQAGSPPRVVVLPGGTTNLIAWDVSRPRGQLKIFERFLKKLPPKIKKRRVLRILPANLYCMFCGAGLLAEGVRLYNKRRQEKGLRGLRNALPVTFWTFIKGLRATDDLPVLTGVERRAATVMLTTLEKVFLPVKLFLKEPCPAVKVGLFPRTIFPFSVLCETEVELKARFLAVDGELLESKERRFVIQTTEEVEFLSW